MTSAPARVGMPLADIDTPALLIDLDALERNIGAMQRRIAGTEVTLRPHAKTHKSTAIAHMQVAAGAIGVCCQKVSEAEIMVDGGVKDVVVSNQVVGATKIARAAALARRARVAVCADDASNIDALAAAATAAGATLGVFVEINVGMNRCGVDTAEAAAALAQRIAAHKSLRFAGVQAYQGVAQHVRGHNERGSLIAAAVEKAAATKAAIEHAGIPCPVIAGAGTGSFEFELASSVYTELQVGSYVFMDADYGQNRDRNGQPVSEFANALFILATVMSMPAPGRAVVDAGLKALSTESGLPILVDCPNATYARAADEHGRIDLSGPPPFKLGDKVKLIPGHCDPTVNLHDWYVGVRNGRVECVWPVSTRGAVF